MENLILAEEDWVSYELQTPFLFKWDSILVHCRTAAHLVKYSISYYGSYC